MTETAAGYCQSCKWLNRSAIRSLVCILTTTSAWNVKRKHSQFHTTITRNFTIKLSQFISQFWTG